MTTVDSPSPNASSPDGPSEVRAPSPGAPDATPRNRTRVAVVTLVILAAFGFLLFKGLGNATVYFKTADEAVAQKSALGTKRFRVEGAVVTGSVRQVGDHVEFTIINAGEEVRVVHQGDPPELFKDGIPVVLEGRWQGDHYASDRIMVKHTTEYRKENPNRVKQYVGKDQPAP